MRAEALGPTLKGPARSSSFTVLVFADPPYLGTVRILSLFDYSGAWCRAFERERAASARRAARC